MIRIILVSLLAVLLFANESYYQELLHYLHNKTFAINGKFYMYDFNKNGKIEYNDWIYLDLEHNEQYRLLATSSTPNNAFGFAKIDPVTLPKQPDGYFVFIGFAKDDSRFSWVYITYKSHEVYKLMGATAEGYFRYLDIDGNNKPDPLGINVSFFDEKSVEFCKNEAITAISTGWYHTCAIKNENLYCWGDNSYGELGDGSTMQRLTPTLAILQNAEKISASKEYTCAITTQHTLYCWGRNQYGKLGNAKVDTTEQPINQIASIISLPFAHQAYATTPQAVVKDSGQLFNDAIDISAGSWHACAINSDHKLLCWGQNFDGALGIGRDPRELQNLTYNDFLAIRNDPTTLQALFWPKALHVHSSLTNNAPLANTAQVAAGSSDHTCAIVENGKVRCWAWNGGEDGELGIDNTTIDYATAPMGYVLDRDKKPLQGVQKIVAGADHTCALVDGKVVCWGSNEVGQLGDLTWQPRAYADVVKKADGTTLTTIIDIFSERGNHTCAIDSNHNLYCWGSNVHGELGTGDRNNRNYATKIAIKPVKLVAAGGGGKSPWEFFIPHEGEHTCTVTLDDEIYCWGANGYGQLGTGDKTDRLTPTKITLP